MVSHNRCDLAGSRLVLGTRWARDLELRVFFFVCGTCRLSEGLETVGTKVLKGVICVSQRLLAFQVDTLASSCNLFTPLLIVCYFIYSNSKQKFIKKSPMKFIISGRQGAVS